MADEKEMKLRLSKAVLKDADILLLDERKYFEITFSILGFV